MTPEQNLERLKINIQVISQPVATYVNCVRVNNLLSLSGKGPLKPDGSYVVGKLGRDLTTEQGYEAARLADIYFPDGSPAEWLCRLKYLARGPVVRVPYRFP
jgi:hypothetical protein